MGIPKLKVYRISGDISRLSSNATTNIINDIQHIQGEELLPFVPKSLDAVLNARKLVGIERTPDYFLRVIKRITDTNGVIVERETDTNANIVKSEQILVNDWIISQNNIQVYASTKDIDIPDGDSEWEEVTNQQFRYELRTQKGQGYNDSDEKTDITSSIVECHDDLYMRIYIGDEFFSQANSKESYKKFKIKCPRIKDLSNSDVTNYATLSNYTANNSVYGLNKGEIYNGTKTGVYKDFNGIKSFDSTSTGGTILPHYYEGNYFYQIKYYPLRIKWIDNSSGEQTVSAPELGQNIDKTVAQIQLFEERIGAYDNKYYQRLTAQQYSISSNSITFTNYYRNDSYPKKIGIVYNLMGDRLNVNFEQDYHYSNLSDGNNLNRGAVFSSNGIIFNQDGNRYYLIQREEKLAVEINYGKDENDLLLTVNGTNRTATFTISNTNCIMSSLMVFDNGQLLSNSMIAISGNTVTINYSQHLGRNLPKDLLVSYNYKLYIQGDIQGIRAIGTIKQKTTDTFVATHPMWVNNHLNQNPDIFVGNTIYSGTSTQAYSSDGLSPHYIEQNEYALSTDVGCVELKQTVTEMDYNYIRNFAKQVSSVIQETTLENVWQYLNYVTANYAYYDSIYMVYQGKFSCYTKQGGCHYALLTDELFDDFKYKKFITLGDNEGFYKTFYKGNEEMPKSQNISGENPTLLSVEGNGAIDFQGKDKRILIKRITTSIVFNYSNSNITTATLDSHSGDLSFSNSNNYLTYSGDEIWNISSSNDVITIPKFKTVYDVSNSDTMRNNMPTIICDNPNVPFLLYFEVFYLYDEQAYVAVYQKTRGNTL